MKGLCLTLLSIAVARSKAEIATNAACLNLPRAFVLNPTSWPELSHALKDKGLYIAFTALKEDALEYESRVTVDGSVQKGSWSIEAASSDCEFNVMKATTELLVDDGAASEGKRTWLNLLNGGVKSFKVGEKDMEMSLGSESTKKISWNSTQVWTNPIYDGIKLTMDNDDF